MYYVIYMYFKLSSGLLQVQPIHMYKEFHFILKFEKWNDDNANRSIVSILLPLSLPRELSVYNYLHWYFPWRDSDTHRVRLYTSAIVLQGLKDQMAVKRMRESNEMIIQSITIYGMK